MVIRNKQEVSDWHSTRGYRVLPFRVQRMVSFFQYAITASQTLVGVIVLSISKEEIGRIVLVPKADKGTGGNAQVITDLSSYFVHVQRGVWRHHVYYPKT